MVNSKLLTGKVFQMLLKLKLCILHRTFTFNKFYDFFSTSLDQYIRRSDNNSKTEKWNNGTFQADAVFRKTENDWNMAYLARIGNSVWLLSALIIFN